MRSLRLMGRVLGNSKKLSEQSDKIKGAGKEDNFHSSVGWPEWKTIGLVVSMLCGANRAAASQVLK